MLFTSECWTYQLHLRCIAIGFHQLTGYRVNCIYVGSQFSQTFGQNVIKDEVLLCALLFLFYFYSLHAVIARPTVLFFNQLVIR